MFEIVVFDEVVEVGVVFEYFVFDVFGVDVVVVQLGVVVVEGVESVVDGFCVWFWIGDEVEFVVQFFVGCVFGFELVIFDILCFVGLFVQQCVWVFEDCFGEV